MAGTGRKGTAGAVGAAKNPRDKVGTPKNKRKVNKSSKSKKGTGKKGTGRCKLSHQVKPVDEKRCRNPKDVSECSMVSKQHTKYDDQTKRCYTEKQMEKLMQQRKKKDEKKKTQSPNTKPRCGKGEKRGLNENGRRTCVKKSTKLCPEDNKVLDRKNMVCKDKWKPGDPRAPRKDSISALKTKDKTELEEMLKESETCVKRCKTKINKLTEVLKKKDPTNEKYKKRKPAEHLKPQTQLINLLLKNTKRWNDDYGNKKIQYVGKGENGDKQNRAFMMKHLGIVFAKENIAYEKGEPGSYKEALEAAKKALRKKNWPNDE